MKMNNWKKMFQAKNYQKSEGGDNYLDELFDNLDILINSEENLPFRIVDVKQSGFVVKLSGLFGYVSFRYMPWKYDKKHYWLLVAPYLKNKKFYCRVHYFSRQPYSLLLNAEPAQFKKPELVQNESYTGVIINKNRYGLFIDTGYHFNWKCGSITGLMHRSDIHQQKNFENAEEGNLIEVYYWGQNEKGDLRFGDVTEMPEWFDGTIEQLIGEVLPVNIFRNPENGLYTYKAEDKYAATLPVTKTIYGENTKRIKKALQYLLSGDVIHCEVIKANLLKRTLQLKWETESEIDMILSRKTELITINASNKAEYGYKNPQDNMAVENRVGGEIREKLGLIGKTVKVEVEKKYENNSWRCNRYSVYGKYNGKLFVSGGKHRLSEKEKKIIEQQLQEGEILRCTVMSISNNQILLQWVLEDAELDKFLN